MVFRMWFDEVEGRGLQQCTPVGYLLHGISEFVGFSGLLALLGVPVHLVIRSFVGPLTWPQFWLLAVPFLLGIIGKIIGGFSWLLAHRKRFRYDYERRISSWREGHQERTYTFPDWQAEVKQRAG